MSDSAMSLPSTSEEESSPPQDLSASGITIPSDSEAFSSLSQPSTSPPQSSVNNTKHDDGSHEQKVVIYSRPTFWTLLRGAAINLLLPFVNGMMLGLGELLAHEIAFRWGWGTMQVSVWQCMAGFWRALGHGRSSWITYNVELADATPFPCDGMRADVLLYSPDISKAQSISNGWSGSGDERRPS